MKSMMRVSRNAWIDALRVLRGETPTHTHLRDRLIAIGVFTAIVDVVASLLVFFLERHADRTEITNFGDSIFWVSSQLLTVSSSMKNPISPGGRVIDVFLEFYAITVVAALAGSFAAFFHRRGRERDAEEPAEGGGG